MTASATRSAIFSSNSSSNRNLMGLPRDTTDRLVNWKENRACCDGLRLRGLDRDYVREKRSAPYWWAAPTPFAEGVTESPLTPAAREPNLSEGNKMAIIDLVAAKAHLNILFDDDDTLIEGKIEAAQAHLESLLGFAIEEEFEVAPGDLKQATLALVAHFYENREATGENLFEAPHSVWDVVRERRSYAWE